MKILPLQLSLNSRSNLGGFIASALFHAVLIVTIINFHSIKIQPTVEENTKISLNSFKTPSLPLPPSPEPPSIQAQAEPINIPIPPEPVVTPPPPPPPVVETKPIPKPEPVKKVEPKPVKKPQEKNTPKKADKLAKPVTEPMPTPPAITQADSTTKEPVAAVTPVQTTAPATTQQTKVSGAQTVGEFNFSSSSSSGDERFAKMQNAIKKHQKYPKKATKMRQQGVVEVSFFFKTNGTVTDVKVVKSSGFETLDEAAMDAIKKACKDFPILEKDYVIKIPMAYKLI